MVEYGSRLFSGKQTTLSMRSLVYSDPNEFKDVVSLGVGSRRGVVEVTLAEVAVVMRRW